MVVNTILNVVIGLIFVFFVCSLAVSGINEAVRKMLNTRSRVLWSSIQRILSEDDELPQGKEDKDTKRNPIAWIYHVFALPRSYKRKPEDRQAGSLFDRFFNHQQIGRLDPAALGRRSKITNLPAADFARVLVDVVTDTDEDGKKQFDEASIRAGIEKLDPVIRDQLLQMFEEVKGDIVKFRLAIEGWFDDAMDRVSDWYKKRTRWAMLVYALLVAVVFNVSAVQITTELYENDIVREALVEIAEATTEQTQQAIDDCKDRECVEREINKLVDTGLPVLWRDCQLENESWTCGFRNGWDGIASVAGWLITAAALSVGASFWFALLKRAFRVKASLPGANA